MSSAAVGRPGSSDIAQQNLSKKPKVQEPPIWAEWFQKFIQTNQESFSKHHGFAITDLPFYQYYSNATIDSRVEAIVRANISTLGELDRGTKLRCGSDGEITYDTSWQVTRGVRPFGYSYPDKIENLKIFSIFLKNCPNDTICDPSRLVEGRKRIFKAIDGLSKLKQYYSLDKINKQFEINTVEEVIQDFSLIVDRLLPQPEKAPLNLAPEAIEFALLIDAIIKDSTLDETDKFMKVHSTLSHCVAVLFTRESFPKIYEADDVCGEIFPHLPKWAFITWIIWKNTSEIKNFSSELGRQYIHFQRVLRVNEVHCDEFVEQRELFVSQQKEIKAILYKSIFDQQFKEFFPLMEKVEKKVSEQATMNGMTVKVGLAVFQLAGGLAGITSGKTPFEVIGHHIAGWSVETLVDKLLKSNYISDNEVFKAKSILEQLKKEWTNPAEAMSKFTKAFTAEMDKLKQAHTDYETMKQILRSEEKKT